jgi:predicted transcriptional regulator
MSILSVTLAEAESERLKELAAREGATPEEIALAALRARLDQDAADTGQIMQGLAELDAGQGMTNEDFEREMDAFMAQLPAQRA